MMRGSVTRVKAITGRGITTSVDMEAADLGIVRWDEDRQAYAVMFGDNFSRWGQQGIWYSPSVVMYDRNFSVLGVPWGSDDPELRDTKMGPRGQLFPYQHNNDVFSTVLPCDFIKIGDTWHMAAMVTKGLGNELNTSFWKSKDLVQWEREDPSLDHQGQGHPGNVMLTFDRYGDYIYIFGTGGLRRDRPLWLWRCHVTGFPHGYWEPWGMINGKWNWGVGNENTPIMGGKFGEICFRMIGGFPVLSYFDSGAYMMVARTTDLPWGDWSSNANAVEYTRGQETPWCYGGYIVDDSRLNQREGMRFLVSQWNAFDGSNDPYHVVLFSDSLNARIPVPIKAPETISTPETAPGLPLLEVPTPTPVSPPEEDNLPVSTEEDLIDVVKELGSGPDLQTPEGTNLTLRGAIGEILEKTRTQLLTLAGRPRNPTQKDDLLGHLLNIRAEGLVNQAFLQKILKNQGTTNAEIQAVRDAVRKSLG